MDGLTRDIKVFRDFGQKIFFRCLVFLMLIIFFLAYSLNIFAREILELGESQLHGKKDQPEGIISLSRSPLDDADSAFSFEAYGKIRADAKLKIFDLKVPFEVNEVAP